MTTTRRLGTTDIEITPIGLGCMQFAGTGVVSRVYPTIDQWQVKEIVGTALEGGINWFDTAEMYGRGGSERALTASLRDLGAEPGSVVVATKWAPLLRRASNIGATVGARLAALRGYPIDLYQIHMPYGAVSSLRSQLTAMAGLCREGRVKAVGVSNFSARQMELAASVLRSHGVTLASNQVRISMLHRDIERNGVLATARRLGVTLIAYSPLHSGILTGAFHDDPARVRALPVLRRRMGDFSPGALARTAPLIAELRAIGRSYGVSPATVALNWLIYRYDDTVVAIPGASKPRQAADNVAAMMLTLTENEQNALAERSSVG